MIHGRLVWHSAQSDTCLSNGNLVPASVSLVPAMLPALISKGINSQELPEDNVNDPGGKQRRSSPAMRQRRTFLVPEPEPPNGR